MPMSARAIPDQWQREEVTEKDRLFREVQTAKTFRNTQVVAPLIIERAIRERQEVC